MAHIDNNDNIITIRLDRNYDIHVLTEHKYNEHSRSSHSRVFSHTYGKPTPQGHIYEVCKMVTDMLNNPIIHMYKEIPLELR